jgi:AcrR family transcriptional regulator
VVSPVAARSRRRPQQRPDELLNAALAVFGERGFRAASLDVVARRAGVSKGTVYLYFASKDALFRAVVERKIVVLLEEGEALLAAHEGTAAELLRLVIHRMQAAMHRDDMIRLARLAHSELAHFPEVRAFWWEHVIQRNRRLLGSIVDRGIAAGEFVESARVVIPRAIPSLLLHQGQIRFLFGDLDPDAPASDTMVDLTMDALLDGVRTRTRDT